MGYKVRYLVQEHETGHELISDFEAAKAIVENYVQSHPTHSAEVRDSEGALRFRRPRTVRSA